MLHNKYNLLLESELSYQGFQLCTYSMQWSRPRFCHICTVDFYRCPIMSEYKMELYYSHMFEAVKTHMFNKNYIIVYCNILINLCRSNLRIPVKHRLFSKRSMQNPCEKKKKKKVEFASHCFCVISLMPNLQRTNCKSAAHFCL